MNTEYTPIVVPLKVRGDPSVRLNAMTNVVKYGLEIETNIVVDPSYIPAYDGSYEVTPLANTETILETAGRRMEDDVTVRKIPYYETTNESGGYTVIIG